MRNGSDFVWGKGNRKGIGQVGSGKVFWFSRQQSEASWPMYAWSSRMAFVFPRLTCVICFTTFFFFFSRSVFIVMGSPLAHFEPVDVASPTIDGACMEIDRLLMAARDILVPKLLCFFRHCECGCYDYEKRMADYGTPYRSPESSSLQSVGRPCGVAQRRGWRWRPVCASG